MDTTISRYVIEADHFAVGYGERTILHDITTKIERGSVTCICGGSGCGKSTFLRSTIGLVPHKGGSVRVLGEDVNALDEAEKAQFLSRVGFMYQNGGLINSLTVLDNLKIPLMAHTQLPDDVIEELVYHKLSQVQLTHAVHLLPGELSGGMLKRAGFARAMILVPELVLSGEPSAGADKGHVKFDGPLADALQSPLPLVKNFFARASQEGHPGMQSLWQRSGANGATRNH